MKIATNLRGTANLLKQLEGLPKKFKEAEVLGITRTAMLLRDTIVKYVDDGHPDHPEVQTGRLKSSIRYVVEEERGNPTAYVGSDAVYAAAVEFGNPSEYGGEGAPSWHFKETGKRHPTKAYPYVRPAITDVFDGGLAQKVFDKTIKEKIKM